MFFKKWFMAARPKTLTAALVPVCTGTALAHSIHHKTQLLLSVFAVICAVLIQIGTNFINDALDFKKGADTQERIGPQRVTQSGLVHFKTVYRAGLACFLFSILFAIPLIEARGWAIIGIGFFSLLAGYVYTGGPYPLAYLGLGDLFVILFFGWVAVLGVYFLNIGMIDLPGWIAGFQIGLLAAVLIAINNLRDYQTDQKANKKTLAVRMGPRIAKIEIALLCMMPFIVQWFWFEQGFLCTTLLPCIVFPASLQLVKCIKKTEPSPVYNQFLAKGAMLHFGFGMLLSLGLLLDSKLIH